MKAAFKTLLAMAVVVAVALVVQAEDKDKAKDEKKEVTLKGELGCAKCVFKVKGIKKCTNAIKVKDGDKEVTYLLIDKGAKEKYHKPICTEKKKGSVTGIKSHKDKQEYITPSKDGVKYDDD